MTVIVAFDNTLVRSPLLYDQRGMATPSSSLVHDVEKTNFLKPIIILTHIREVQLKLNTAARRRALPQNIGEER